VVGATLMLFAISGRFGLRDRLLISESLGVNQLSGIPGLVTRVALFAIAAELLGAVIFYFRWSASGLPAANFWLAIFHSASAFNNCGMDLFGGFQSMAAFVNDPVTLITTAILILIGSTGYFVISDIIRNRKFGHLTLNSKIVLFTAGGLIISSMLFLFICEFDNPSTLGSMPLPQKFLSAFFQSITTRTAGFSSIDNGGLNELAIFAIILLMCIGGAAGSTAGGIKVNTFGILMITIINIIRGRSHISVFGRQLTNNTIYRAFTLTALYLAVAGLIITLLTITENFPMDKIIFETFSALSTVGLSTGITPELSSGGRIILIFAMFFGRLGPITFVAFLVRRRQRIELEYPHESIKLG
jgi:trk system potassium uptake protein